MKMECVCEEADVAEEIEATVFIRRRGETSNHKTDRKDFPFFFNF